MPAGQEKPAVQITIPQTQNKITSALWGALDEYLIFGHEKGELSQWDIKNVEEVITKYEDHRDKVNDLQLSKDGSMLISSSKDTYAKVGVLLAALFRESVIIYTSI